MLPESVALESEARKPAGKLGTAWSTSVPRGFGGPRRFGAASLPRLRTFFPIRRTYRTKELERSLPRHHEMVTGI